MLLYYLQYNIPSIIKRRGDQKMKKRMRAAIWITLVIVFLVSLVLISLSVLNYRLSNFNEPIQSNLLEVKSSIGNSETGLEETEDLLEKLIQKQQTGDYENFDDEVDYIIKKLDETEKNLNSTKEDIEEVENKIGG